MSLTGQRCPEQGAVLDPISQRAEKPDSALQLAAGADISRCSLRLGAPVREIFLRPTQGEATRHRAAVLEELPVDFGSERELAEEIFNHPAIIHWTGSHPGRFPTPAAAGLGHGGAQASANPGLQLRLL